MTLARTSAASSGSERAAARRAVPLWPPGVRTSSNRELRRAGRPVRSCRAARRARRSRAPVTGRARTWTMACSPAARPLPAAARARSGSRIVIGLQRQDLGAGQPQRPPGRQRPGRERRRGGGGDGVGAGPGGLDGPLDHAGRHGPGDPHADRHDRAGPGVLEPDMRLAVPQPGPRRAQQPGQVPPQRLTASRVRLRRGQHRDHPGTGGEGGVLAAAQPPPGQHCRDQGGGQQRPGCGTLVDGGVQQDAGDAGGHRRPGRSGTGPAG